MTCSSMPIWPERTVKSGSAMVTKTPKAKVMKMTRKKFFFLTREPPMTKAISVIEVSVPMLNIAMPAMMKTTEMTNP